MNTLIAGAVGWVLLLGGLIFLLASPAPAATSGPLDPSLKPERIQMLTCTTKVAIVDTNGETHIKTIDCKEEK